MVHNNKVLTVSYGTFSCTLEGFDDSFGTMKAIAEYFRDLASDDRYFGAEPPQPDADMLARIAQREISRQVEAHSTSTGGFVLRAADAEAETEVANAPPAVSTPAPETAPEQIASSPVAQEVVVPIAVQATIQTPISESVQTSVQAPAPAPESIAAAAASPEPVAQPTMEQETQAPIPEAVEIEAPAAEAPKAEIVETIAPEVSVAVTETLVTPEPLDQLLQAETPVLETAEVQPGIPPVVKLSTPTPVAPPVEAELVTEPVAEPEIVPAADSIAAKLQRIRAVVSQNEAIVQSDDYTEDQHAVAFMAPAMSDVTQDPEDDPEMGAQNVDAAVLQVLDRLNVSGTTVETPTDKPARMPEDTEVAAEIMDDDEPVDVITPSAPSAPGLSTVPNVSEPLDTGLFDDLDEGEEDPVQDNPTANVLTTDEPLNILSDEDTAPDHAPARARVIKVKRADLEAAIATGEIEQVSNERDEITTPADQDITQKSEPKSSLSDEDEAELLRDLAAVEDDHALDIATTNLSDTSEDDWLEDDDLTGYDDDDDDLFAEDQDPQTDHHSGLAQTADEGEADLSRLMAEADQKLDDPENSTSRDTYSHLRAAVAVAQAEKSAGGSIGDDSTDDAYRSDLASVVRPRRPAIGSTRGQRPEETSRPAPLKLVAEQRVDNGANPTKRGPVRPRRVSTLPLEGFTSDVETDTGFAEFAVEMDATELPDLLEAAAAYISFVEGREKFSRPQLMSKVRQIKPDDFDREDGLRSFGQLLRDGKIVKCGGGRFAVSGDIGFRPVEREVG